MAFLVGTGGAKKVSGKGGRRKVPAKLARKWSADVTRRSNALDLRPGVFKLRDPSAIARSLRRSALQSRRRKTDPFRSAMSMLNLYINRAGTNLSPERRRVLDRAKDELRKAFGHA